MADPYSVLGVDRSADEKAIKAAYRKLAKKHHPDANQDNPKAAERFGQITSAYDLLTDKNKRAAFDRGEIDADGNPKMPAGFGYGGAGGTGGPQGGGRFDFNEGGVDLGDIFDGLFSGGGGRAGFQRGRSAPPPKSANIAYRLAVPFLDAATGAPQRITLGDGKTIDLKLPAGVESGTQMRVSGKGQPGPGGAGDAIISITVSDHPWFRRDGDDIRIDLPVTISEAMAGGKVKVPTPDGPVMLTVPAATTSSKTLRIKGRGWTGKTGVRGDQLVTIVIDLPTDDNDFAKRLDGWTDTRNPRLHMGV